MFKGVFFPPIFSISSDSRYDLRRPPGLPLPVVYYAEFLIFGKNRQKIGENPDFGPKLDPSQTGQIRLSQINLEEIFSESNC